MKLSVEIILIIIIGIIILFNACSETEYFADVAGTTIAGADIDSIRNLNSIASTLMQPDGTLTNPGNLNVAGKTTSEGEMIGTLKSGLGQFRAIAGDYGTILRQDGGTFYLLTTNKGAPTGDWSTLRPFYIDNKSGNVTMQHDVGIGGKLSIPGFGDVANTLGRISAVQVFDLNGPDYMVMTNLSSQFTLPSGTKILIVNWQGYYRNNQADTRFAIINQANGAIPWAFAFKGNGNNVHVGQSIIKVIPDATVPAGNYKLKVDTDMGLDRDYLNAAIITLP